MTGGEIIRGLAEERLDALFPAAADGSDGYLLKMAADGALREVLSLSASSEMPECLYEAAADIAAADFIKYSVSRGRVQSFAAEQREGDLTLKYADGCTSGELLLSAAESLRRRGTAEAISKRRLIW